MSSCKRNIYRRKIKINQRQKRRKDALKLLQQHFRDKLLVKYKNQFNLNFQILIVWQIKDMYHQQKVIGQVLYN